MSRYHITLIISALLGALALAFGHFAWLGMVAIAQVTIIGLGAAFPQISLFGPYRCHGPSSPRRVALTFDDGPDARSTPALLELLREEGVRAAFFCIGQRVAANPALAARMVREGHLVENHSHQHNPLMNCHSVPRLQAEINQAQTAIQQATGVAPTLYRPPLGLSNPRTFRVARALGLKVVGWSARGYDTQSTQPRRIVARILWRLKPGAIILLHDGNIPPERLLVTVKLLLAKLREQGCEIVRVDEFLK